MMHKNCTLLTWIGHVHVHIRIYSDKKICVDTLLTFLFPLEYSKKSNQGNHIYMFYIYIFFSCTFRTKFNLIPKGETLRSLHRHKSAWLHHFEMQTCGWTHIHPYRQTAKKVSGPCLCILIPLQPAQLGRYLIFPACSAGHRGGLAGTQRQIYDKSLLPLWFTAVIGPGWTHPLDTGSNVFEKILKKLMRETRDVL